LKTVSKEIPPTGLLKYGEPSVPSHRKEVFVRMKNQKQPEEQLSSIKVKQLTKQPIIESAVSKSEDGKWIIHKTVITDIKPISYFDKVMGNK